jgi:hypothetical protein
MDKMALANKIGQLKGQNLSEIEMIKKIVRV